MSNNPATNLPDGYLWVEEIARIEKMDENDLIKLCKLQYLQSRQLGGHWAIRVINIHEVQFGNVLVRDLKAGGNITIGDIINNAVIYQKEDNRGREAIRTQKPSRDKIETARKWIHVSWFLLGGGAVFAIVGLVFTWIPASISVIPAWTNATEALRLAEKHGDRALIDEAKYVLLQSQTTAVILWGGIILVFCLIVTMGLSG